MNILPEGEGKGRKLPSCLKAVIGAAFGCLTVNYGHIYNFFCLFLDTLVAGKVHSLLINFLFITAQKAVFIIKMFIFLCSSF